MTTIAFDGKNIARDTRATDTNGLIVNDNENKHRKQGGWHYFFAGTIGDIAELIRCHQESVESNKKKPDVECLAVKDGKVYNCSLDADGFTFEDKPLTRPHAIGSGAGHAFTAMDLGCDAREAVKMAMKRDPNTGGRIKVFKVVEPD